MSAEDGRTGPPLVSSSFKIDIISLLTLNTCTSIRLHDTSCNSSSSFFLLAIQSKLSDTMSLAAYRNLMRAARIAFQGKMRSLENPVFIYNPDIKSKTNNWIQATCMSFQPPRTRSDRASKRTAHLTPTPTSRRQSNMPRTWPPSCARTLSKEKRLRATATSTRTV